MSEELEILLTMLAAALLTWALVGLAGFTIEGSLILSIGLTVIWRGLVRGMVL